MKKLRNRLSVIIDRQSSLEALPARIFCKAGSLTNNRGTNSRGDADRRAHLAGHSWSTVTRVSGMKCGLSPAEWTQLMWLLSLDPVPLASSRVRRAATGETGCQLCCAEPSNPA